MTHTVGDYEITITYNSRMEIFEGRVAEVPYLKIIGKSEDEVVKNARYLLPTTAEYIREKQMFEE